jgi:hypothetical protein
MITRLSFNRKFIHSEISFKCELDSIDLIVYQSPYSGELEDDYIKVLLLEDDYHVRICNKNGHIYLGVYKVTMAELIEDDTYLYVLKTLSSIQLENEIDKAIRSAKANNAIVDEFHQHSID